MGDPYDISTLEKIRDKLLENQCTVAVGESVTSGLVQHAFSQVKDAMKIYQGGITTYNLGQKTHLLGVNPIHAEACNCVSEQVAVEMALKVARRFRCQFGIGVTGYASPVPELSIDKLFACYAVSKNNAIVGQGKIEFDDSSEAQAGAPAKPIEVQYYFTNEILRIFLSLLK